MTTDTSERKPELLVIRHLTGLAGLAITPGTVADPSRPYGGTGDLAGSPTDYHSTRAKPPWHTATKPGT